MFFCPNCRNAYDIARTAIDVQSGGKSDNTSKENSDVNDTFTGIIDKLINNQEVEEKDVVKLDIDKLVKSISYKKLSSKQKELVYNKIQDKLPDDKKVLMSLKPTEANDANVAYFVCKNCIYNKPIKEGTLIYSKTSEDIAQTYDTHDDKNKIHSNILPITRKYICPNKNCISHTNLEKREATIFRLHNSFAIKYICKACETMWKP